MHVSPSSSSQDQCWCFYFQPGPRGTGGATSPTMLQCTQPKVDYSPFQKKTEPWQPQLVDWYKRRPLRDPNWVFAYRSKKTTTMFGAKAIVLSWCLVLFPAAAVWTPLCVAAQSTSFLLLSIFRLHGCYFSGWFSPVDGYWFQKHQPSRPTTVTKRGRDVTRNPDVLLQIDKGEAHPKKSTSALTKENKI